MKHLEKLVETLESMTERYGITMTEVPDRLREKILAKTGNECSADLDLLLKPLLDNFLRPIRIRAGNRVSESVVEKIVAQTASIDGYDADLAKKVVEIWMKVFKVKIGELAVADSKMLNEFDILTKQLEIKDTISLHTDESVERVVNQFDSNVPVYEPTVEDYDGKFGDLSFEKVADFKISDAENKVTIGIESFAPGNPSGSARLEEKSAKARHGKSPKTKNIVAPPVEFVDKSQPALVKNTIDDAFKQLRNNNFEYASKIMMELARNGNIRAQFHLGEFYLMGTGVEINEDKAKYWFRKASASGSMQAKQKLEQLESSGAGGGCMGCGFTVVIVLGGLKLLSMMAGL